MALAGVLSVGAGCGGPEPEVAPRPTATASAPEPSLVEDIKTDRILTELERRPIKGAVLLRQPIKLSASAEDARKEPRFSKGRASVAGELWAAEVVEDLGDVVRIRNVEHVPYRTFLAGLEVEAFVRKTHLAPVLARPVIDTFREGAAVALEAGTPVAVEDGRLAVVDLRLDGFPLNHQHRADLSLGFPVGADPVVLKPLGNEVRCAENGGLAKEGAPCELPGDAVVRVKDRSWTARALGGPCAAVRVATDTQGEMFVTFELASGPVRARVVSGAPTKSRCGEAVRPALELPKALEAKGRASRKVRAASAVLLESGAAIGRVGKLGATVWDAEENEGRLCYFPAELGHALCFAPKDVK